MKVKKLGKIIDGQDGAVFNGFLFRFGAKGNCTVYNLKDCLVGAAPAIARFSLDRADEIVPHSNSVAFGNEYYCKDDEFPLLYSNIYNNYSSCEEKLKGVTCVYRIQKNGTDFSTQLVQLIEIGFTEDNIWCSADKNDVRPYGNFAIDRENAVYYAFATRDQDQITRYFSFDLPSLQDGVYDKKFGINRVVLTKQDIKETFDCPYHNCVQGACYHKGLIYSLEGFSPEDIYPSAIRIIDTNKKAQKQMYLFGEFGLTVEPEMIDFVNDICYYCDNHGNLYELEF